MKEVRVWPHSPLVRCDGFSWSKLPPVLRWCTVGTVLKLYCFCSSLAAHLDIVKREMSEMKRRSSVKSTPLDGVSSGQFYGSAGTSAGTNSCRKSNSVEPAPPVKTYSTRKNKKGPEMTQVSLFGLLASVVHGIVF